MLEQLNELKDLSAAKDDKVGYIIGEHARVELIKPAGVSYKGECDMQVRA